MLVPAPFSPSLPPVFVKDPVQILAGPASLGGCCASFHTQPVSLSSLFGPLYPSTPRATLHSSGIPFLANTSRRQHSRQPPLVYPPNTRTRPGSNSIPLDSNCRRRAILPTDTRSIRLVSVRQAYSRFFPVFPATQRHHITIYRPLPTSVLFHHTTFS